jgi:regulator of cell morphogenesis and NO signaling
MDMGILGTALEREHRQIDAGVESFSAGLAQGGGEAEPLTRAIEALRRHIYLEEAFLFPPMRDKLAIPMSVMVREHGEIWRTLDALEAKLGEDGADPSMLAVCEELVEQLDRHNSKEEPIFYTQADAALTPAASVELQAFIDSGQMPDGWDCQAARA